MQRNTACTVKQSYGYHPEMPFAELRYSHNSQCGYKAHSHKAFSLGAIVDGSTLLTIGVAEKALTLHLGDLVLIEPDCVHSCNPINNGGRSYFMLYMESGWLLNQARQILGEGIEAIHFDTPVVWEPDLFQKYLRFTREFQQKQFSCAKNTLSSLLSQLVRGYVRASHDCQSEVPLLRNVMHTYSHNLDSPPVLRL